jgi:capsular exopolysaccharide synthesis family protein
MDAPSATASSFWSGRLLSFLLKYWWIPLLTLAFFFAIEVGYAHWKQPTFVSKASMWETVQLRLPEGGVFFEDMQNYVGTLSALLRSDALRQQALALLKASTNTASIAVDKHGERLLVDIRVSAKPKSSVFDIQASSSDPLFTQSYLNAVMEAYLDYKKNARKEVSGDTLASISEQMLRWEQDLNIARDAQLTFERTNDLAILQEEATVAGGYLTKLKTELSDFQFEAKLLGAAQSDTEHGAGGAANNAALLSAGAAPGVGPSISEDATRQRQSSFQDLELLKIQRERLSKYLKPKHPKMVKLDADIERGEKLEEVFRRQDASQLTAEREANKMKIDTILASIKEWEAKVVEANLRIAEAERLKLNVERIQSVYDRLVLLVQNVGISRNIDQEALAILEPASSPKRSYTDETTGLMLAVLGGLAAGLGIVVLIAGRDDRFTSVSEVNSTLGDSVLGLLPEVDQNGESIGPLLEINDTRHMYAESYRNLRSALLFLAPGGERPKVLLIASAMPNEGKSTVAANLARTLAGSGARVLLVDADLRKGHLEHLLDLKREPGLAELLTQTCDYNKVKQTDSLPNLTFISCGERPYGNPGDLFLSSGLDQILVRWRQEFDYVVIDSSPLFAADDASCLAPKVDGTLLVVRGHHSSARVVCEALALLAQRQARVLGVIFNGADTSSRSYYYKYADYYPSTKQA